MAGSRTGSTRPPRRHCWACSTTRPAPAGHCAAPATSWNSARSARTAGSPGARWGSWPTRHRADHPCMGCSTPKPPRSWPCSTSGARPTAAIVSWPTAAPTCTGCGCRRRACAVFCSWPTSISGRCPDRAARSANRFRTGWTTSPTRSGSTTRPISPGRGWRC